jgi:hypothetical protein
MPRQPSDLLSSSTALREAANALRSAIKERLPDAVEKIGTTTAAALDAAQTAIEGIENRLRRLGEPNTPDPLRRASLVVSGDRIRGGVSVSGVLESVRGQSVDLTLENQTGYIYSRDHGTGALLDLVLNGSVTVQASGDFNVNGRYLQNGAPIRIYTTQAVLTASRAPGAVYQNTTGKSMLVVACWDLANKASTLRYVSDTSATPTTEVAQISNSSPQGVTVELFCVVLPNYYYSCQIVSGGPNLVSWVEYT